MVADEGDLFQDIVLHLGDARGEEDDGEEGDATESSRLHGAVFLMVSSALVYPTPICRPASPGMDEHPRLVFMAEDSNSYEAFGEISQSGSFLDGPASEMGLVVVPSLHIAVSRPPAPHRSSFALLRESHRGNSKNSATQYQLSSSRGSFQGAWHSLRSVGALVGRVLGPEDGRLSRHRISACSKEMRDKPCCWGALV